MARFILPGAARGSRLHPAEYRCWSAANRRCYDRDHEKYEQYGALGISVHPRWRASFLAFVADVGPRPPGAQLDRYPDALGNYEPGNVRWASRTVNNRNRGCTILVERNGKQVPLSELAEQHGIPHDVLRKRVQNYGWPLERALKTPVQPHGGDFRLPYAQRQHVRTRGKKAA
jgi:hypothetical protein